MWGKLTGFVVPAVLVMSGLGACGQADDAPVSPRAAAAGEEPARDVEYEVITSGLGGELVDVRFTGPEGDQLDTRMTSPIWTQRVRTRPGTPVVSLTATNKSVDRWYDITCRITVDGREVAETTSTLACGDQFTFSRLASLPPESTREPTLPPGCDLVGPDDVKAVLADTTVMSGRVESSSTDGPRCTHLLALGSGSVSFYLDAVEEPGPPGTKVKGLKERATFEGTGKGGELRVALPDGNTFVLQLAIHRGRADARKVATDLYRKARPRLVNKP